MRPPTHSRASAGVDVVHCHSSHHAKGAEVYRGKLVLYGAGDLISDYEGIEVRRSPGHVGGRLGCPRLLCYIPVGLQSSV